MNEWLSEWTNERVNECMCGWMDGIHSVIHPKIYPSIHPHIHSFTRSFVHSLSHSFIRSFVYWTIQQSGMHIHEEEHHVDRPASEEPAADHQWGDHGIASSGIHRRTRCCCYSTHLKQLDKSLAFYQLTTTKTGFFCSVGTSHVYVSFICTCRVTFRKAGGGICPGRIMSGDCCFTPIQKILSEGFCPEIMYGDHIGGLC